MKKIFFTIFVLSFVLMPLFVYSFQPDGWYGGEGGFMGGGSGEPVDPNTTPPGPVVSSGSTAGSTLDEFISKLADNIINPIILLMFAVSLLVFFWGIFEYIRYSDSDDKRKIGKEHMIWGLIGLTIMVSAFAIINLALNTIFP